MYCHECGTQLPDGAMFCPNCGTGTGSAASTTQGSTAEQPHTPSEPAAAPTMGAAPTAPVRHRHFPFGTIVAAVILVAAVWMLFTNYGNRPIRDLKGIILPNTTLATRWGRSSARICPIIQNGLLKNGGMTAMTLLYQVWRICMTPWSRRLSG